jgi:DNA-binding XRE family transcriptional regulator
MTTTPDMRSFARSLRACYGMHGLTQGQVADAVGVSRQAVKGWLNGDVIPHTLHAIALAELFGIKFDLLLWGETEDVVMAAAKVYVSAPAHSLTDPDSLASISQNAPPSS